MKVKRRDKDKKQSLPSALKKIEKMDASIDKRFLIACIVSSEFNNAIHKNKDIIKELLPSKVAKTIFGWTSSFYEKYSVAINSSLTNKYSEVEDKIDDAIADDIP